MGCGGTCCQEAKVLDHGFVRLVKVMAEDADVVQAARVSYGKGTKTPEEDARLIRYLMKNHHETPFEHNYFKFHIKAPIFVARQWFRHRIGVSYNEISMRYSEAKDEFYLPAMWREQDSVNKQGSTLGLDDRVQAECDKALEYQCRAAMHTYRSMVDRGVAREMARMVLPVNLYTEWYWTVNARSLMNFLRLRLDGHAQWETRQYAEAILPFFKEYMPVTAEAFRESIQR